MVRGATKALVGIQEVRPDVAEATGQEERPRSGAAVGLIDAFDDTPRGPGIVGAETVVIAAHGGGVADIGEEHGERVALRQRPAAERANRLRRRGGINAQHAHALVHNALAVGPHGRVAVRCAEAAVDVDVYYALAHAERDRLHGAAGLTHDRTECLLHRALIFVVLRQVTQPLDRGTGVRVRAGHHDVVFRHTTGRGGAGPDTVNRGALRPLEGVLQPDEVGCDDGGLRAAVVEDDGAGLQGVECTRGRAAIIALQLHRPLRGNNRSGGTGA